MTPGEETDIGWGMGFPPDGDPYGSALLSIAVSLGLIDSEGGSSRAGYSRTSIKFRSGSGDTQHVSSGPPFLWARQTTYVPNTGSHYIHAPDIPLCPSRRQQTENIFGYSSLLALNPSPNPREGALLPSLSTANPSKPSTHLSTASYSIFTLSPLTAFLPLALKYTLLASGSFSCVEYVPAQSQV
ncbi:hypothetical protein P691DRAFT_802635 [Macrolepiota fuliginosa MF-IS2]|uniref:Uncharacterized protein n=1 Tax=Macrolepiota fuliginosa MF-IS2 TaxID=1400762 RepID=A0A9P6C3B6_9AGAR|nr:hypothetical protein P691DRAFT_802635 [Macrolepiota fuliginosa MF-IS2]